MNVPFIFGIPIGISVEAAFRHDIVQMVIHAGLMVKAVLVVLLLLSIISWAIIFFKLRLLGKAKRQTASFLEVFWDDRGLKRTYAACKALSYSPVVHVFIAGYTELSRIQKIHTLSSSEDGQGTGGSEEFSRAQQVTMDNLERSLRKAAIDQSSRLERAVGFLATTGNTAPFIGLFGTVWGIMNSFRGIGLKGSANLAVVAPGISEALIATAAGLAAAIPAVVAFNYITQRIVTLRAEMDIFTSDFSSMVERQFFKRNDGYQKMT
ncbi:MAG: MotA/TolQ/ExbB proton channel family protein [Thermodesulfobacteriota bacterium]|nr:MotA/TolQ/ExbB proton channel family protein [Thermodesulfobacteriota bacterium]